MTMTVQGIEFDPKSWPTQPGPQTLSIIQDLIERAYQKGRAEATPQTTDQLLQAVAGGLPLEERVSALAMHRLLEERAAQPPNRVTLLTAHETHRRWAYSDITKAEAVLKETAAAIQSLAEEATE